MPHAYTCGVTGCLRPKTSKAGFCSVHNGRNARNGHPTMSAITSKDVLPYMVRVASLLRPQRETHEGLKLACRELDDLLQRSLEGVRQGRPQRPHERHLARLAIDGVEGINILEATAGVLLFDQENGHRIKGERALQFAIARAVCGLAARRGMPVGAKVAEPLATLLLTRYMGLLRNIIDYFRKEDEQEQRRARLLSTPLQPTATGRSRT